MTRIAIIRQVVLAACVAALITTPAHAIRVGTWNMLHYTPDAENFATRQGNFRIVMGAMNVDLLVCQEMNSPAGADSFKLGVLDAVAPGEWDYHWTDVSGEGMGVFWKTAKMTTFAWAPVWKAFGLTRAVTQFGVNFTGYGPATQLNVYSVHLKAGNGAVTPTDSTKRRVEGNIIRDQLNFLSAGTPFLLMGDANFYGASEGGYQALTQSQADNDGRLKDPLPLAGNWHSVTNYSLYYTQCPCLTSCVSSDFSGGGMDDRFDLILVSYPMADLSGLDYVPSSTNAYGNDGQHYQKDINNGTNFAVGNTVATALRSASDHIPVLVTVQLPPKLGTVSRLDIGRAFVGSAAATDLPVSDATTAPADELDYAMVASPGFSVTADPQIAFVGAPPTLHAVTMDTSVPAQLNGDLTITSDDPDTASKRVLLSGTVVRHAVSSLDSSDVVTAATVNFGEHFEGDFVDREVRLHNVGADALQSLLSIASAVITGGDGRFSIDGGFTPTALGGLGKTWSLHFQEVDGTLDSTYTATLRFTTSEEAIPGQAPTSPIELTLLARTKTGNVGVGTPTRVLSFAPARPNPLSRGTSFAYQLPRAQHVSLVLYDLGGRRVASLVSGVQGAGAHEAAWNARDERGARVPGGLYFARFATDGLTRIERLIVLP